VFLKLKVTKVFLLKNQPVGGKDKEKRIRGEKGEGREDQVLP